MVVFDIVQKIINMTSKDISSVTDQLAKTVVDEQYELSFKGKGLKLDTAKDGNLSLYPL